MPKRRRSKQGRSAPTAAPRPAAAVAASPGEALPSVGLQASALALFVAMVAGAALVGARFEPGAWYQSIQKPPWTPPSWVFGPAWTLLYACIAAAGWLAWRAARGRAATVVLGAWGAQLVLNAAWSWLFFGLRRPGLALAEILVLLGVIVACIAIFRRVSRAASWLFVPYALWVGFATSLNAAIWHLNR